MGEWELTIIIDDQYSGNAGFSYGDGAASNRILQGHVEVHVGFVLEIVDDRNGDCLDSLAVSEELK